MRYVQFLAVVCALGLPVQGHAQVTADTQMAPRLISVSGEGQVEAVPDMATITLGVTFESKQARDAMNSVSQSVARILAQLTKDGIAARDIQTQRLSLNPVWSNKSYGNDGRAHISGYSASNSVLVRVRDLDRLGEILDAVVSDGANNFNGLQFSVQDPAPLISAARTEAVGNAIATAQLLADAAGVTLGAVQTITQQGGQSRPMMMEMASARGGSVPVAAGEITVQANVMMTFAITE